MALMISQLFLNFSIISYSDLTKSGWSLVFIVNTELIMLISPTRTPRIIGL